MEELFRKYKVKIREFEIEAGKAKVICRDVLPKEELIEKISRFKVVLYLYPNFFALQGLTVYSSQEFLLGNLDKVIHLSELIDGRSVVYYGEDLDLLEFLVKHTVDKKLRVIKKGNWLVVNNLVYNLSCGELGLISLLMHLHEMFKILIVGNCDFIQNALFFINRGVIVFLENRFFLDGSVMSPPDIKIINYLVNKPLKNRYEISSPSIDIVSKIKELEENYKGRRITIIGSSISVS